MCATLADDGAPGGGVDTHALTEQAAIQRDGIVVALVVRPARPVAAIANSTRLY
jgi:hypothetical protein